MDNENPDFLDKLDGCIGIRNGVLGGLAIWIIILLIVFW
jgi:hypothetical protein